MDKAALEALLARIDIWLLVFGIVVVVGVAGESFFGIRHWWNSRKLQALQNAENETQRAEIARLNREAAELNKKAEEERLARVKIEQQLAPRRVGPDQTERFLADLAPLKGKHVSMLMLGGAEVTEYGESIAALLERAGLTVQMKYGLTIGGEKRGISLVIGANRIKDAQILSRALVSAGFAKHEVPSQLVHEPENVEMLEISIGSKE